MGALGDLFYALPAVNSLKKAFPNSQIDWLVTDTLAEALSPFTEISNVIKFNGEQIFKGSLFSRILGTLKLRKKIENYDAILLLHRHPAHLLPFLGKGKVFRLTRSRSLLDLFAHSTVIPPLAFHESLAIKKLVTNMVQFFKAQMPPGWKINYPKQTQNEIVVHLGGGENLKTEFKLKQWPKMVELIASLINSKEEKIVLVGAPNELGLALDVCKNISDKSRITNLVGKTSLPELILQISRAKIFIGPDSGPLHIADQLGVLSVGIFGPTSTVSWGLINENSKTVLNKTSCHPCYKDDGYFPECKFEHRCMTELSAQQVLTTVLETITR